MNTILVVSVVDTVCAIVFMGLAIPLIKRKIPMNYIYGARFKASFKSNKNWYEINEYGGKCLFWASIPILVHGILGIFFYKNLQEWYLWTGVVGMLLVLGIAAFKVYSKAQEIDKTNTNKSVM